MQLMVLRECSAPSWYWGPLGGCQQLIHCVFLSLPVHRYWLLQCNVAIQYRVPSKACIVPEKWTVRSCFYRIIKLLWVLSSPIHTWCIREVLVYLWCQSCCLSAVQNSRFTKISSTLAAVSCFLRDIVSFERGTHCLLIERELFGCKENKFFPSMSFRLNDMKTSVLWRFYLWMQTQLLFVVPYLICASGDLRD
jgi:hypothetical protein